MEEIMNIHPLDPSWYQYLLREGDSPGWAYGSKWRDTLHRYWCRIKGHPLGPVYYNIMGTEPDDRCNGCGDHI